MAVETAISPSLSDERAHRLFERDLHSIYRRTDHMFIALLILQWIAGIVLACVISPKAWEGLAGHIHVHVYAAIFLGGLIVALPIIASLLYPGSVASRHIIAAGQVLFSALLIHLTGGRIETHFHVFGSLAFLAMYRDWRVLITASLIVGADHFLRGVYWPQSVYGILTPSPWRWMEHVTWVLFEDTVLVFAIRQSLREMKGIATRQTALEEASQRAEAADQAKGAFLAQMSHEIRTPMTAILGYADIMAIEGESHASESVKAIRSNGQHLLTLLDDILDLSKIESGQLRIERAPCNIAELLQGIHELMLPRAAQRGIDLSVELKNIPPLPLITDAVRVRQIVLNLVSNAIKFTERGTVRITAESSAAQSGDVLKISVVDTGIGLTPEQVSRLFKAFTQADDSHHRRYGGTGLGLVISRRLVAMLGGSIEVKSQHGEGSTFSVMIPTEVDRNAEILPTRASIPAAPMFNGNALHANGSAKNGKRILVIDDSRDNRKLLMRLLSHGGYDVQVADDGSSGVAAALAARDQGHSFDLILMDMLMPNLDGYQATRQLREKGLEGLIFALTAYASVADEEKCRSAGCDDYITKPFDCQRLLELISARLQVAVPHHRLDLQLAGGQP